LYICNPYPVDIGRHSRGILDCCIRRTDNWLKTFQSM
jgi:hypothetical protein